MPSVHNSIRSIAIGSFDGMHVAHRELIGSAEAVAVIERRTGRLTPGYKRSWYCDKPMAFYLFEKIRDLSAEEFVDLIRRDFPSLERIVVGYDFRFGRGKTGSAETLRRIFPGTVKIVEEIRVGGVPVHSRTIRGHLEAGEIGEANRLLGRPYTIDGEAIAGQGLGKKELVPTINLRVEDYQLPREGVYAARTRWEDRVRPSVVFVGHRVTTDGSFAVETHLLDTDPGRVSGRVFIDFGSFIRANRRFESRKALRRQIEEDIRRARALTAGE